MGELHLATCLVGVIFIKNCVRDAKPENNENTENHKHEIARDFLSTSISSYAEEELLNANATRRICAKLVDCILILTIYYAFAKIVYNESIRSVGISVISVLELYISSLLVFWLCNITLIVNNGQTI